jgi:primosomal protein N' (replication factor Y)
MTQVSGRAGRKKKQGRVIVQAFQVQHPVLREVKQYDFMGFLARELQERQDFQYPPFTRLIKIQLKHLKVETVQQAAQTFAERLKLRLGEQVLGPAAPGVPRVRGFFLMDIMLKLPRGNQGLKEAKAWIAEVQEYVKIQKGFSALKISIDVDPY